MWDEVVHREIFRHRFLSYGMLAFSALHSSVVHPDERHLFSMLFRKYLSMAMPGFQKLLKDANSQDTDILAPCYAMGTLLACISLASLSDNAPVDMSNGIPLPVTFDNILSFITMTRGVVGILTPQRLATRTLLYGVEISDHWDGWIKDIAKPKEPQNRYDALRYDVRNLMGAEGVVHEGVIADLESVSKQVKGEAEQGDASSSQYVACSCAGWVARLPEEFVNHFRSQETAAIVIFQQFIEIIRLGDEHWMLNGWARNTQRAIDQILTTPNDS